MYFYDLCIHHVYCHDSIVYLNFMVGLNFFTDKFGDSLNMTEYRSTLSDYARENSLPKEFMPIEINLKTDLRKKYQLELTLK